MIQFRRFAIAACLAISPTAARAQADESSLIGKLSVPEYRQSPSSARAAILIGPGLGDLTGGGAKNYQSGGDRLNQGFAGSVALSFGRGLITGEIGAGVVRVPSVILTSGADGKSVQRAVLSDYVGAPFAIKLNYVERRMASFFLKAGAMPIQLISSPEAPSFGTAPGIDFQPDDVLIIGGIGGTTALTDALSFILDISHYWGAKPIYKDGPKTDVFVATVGLSFEL